MEEKDITYDMPIHTDREISANRPDIVTKNNRAEEMHYHRCGYPSDKNTSTKVSEKNI